MAAGRIGATLVAVGDKKTPVGWRQAGAQYLSPEEQNRRFPELAAALPWNSYSRKMLGYAVAINGGADSILDTDDDNAPVPGWSPVDPAQDTALHTVAGGGEFVNAYQRFTRRRIWPRGFPLRLVNDAKLPPLRRQRGRVGVWQGLADGDPDVDAIWRLTSPLARSQIKFQRKTPITLEAGTPCPFNSQNTLFRRELFPTLYLPTTVSFRFCDILRGLVAQPIMWAAGLRLGFTGATVFQARNAHDLTRDFNEEAEMHRYGERAYTLSAGAVNPSRSVADNLAACYWALARDGIVQSCEITVLDTWLQTLRAI